MEDWKEELFKIGKEILVSLVILGIILGSLYAYTGRWPPMVVIESSSMSHSQESRVGIIDTGDIVLVRDNDRTEIITYVEGKANDYIKYGQYGDVIIYRPMGNLDRTPIIHRPVVYLELNQTTDNSFDIPSLNDLQYDVDWSTSQGERWYNLTGIVYIFDYGFRDARIEINLNELLEDESKSHSGYITMGDNNVSPTGRGRYDQATNICPAPVRSGWVIGVARGQLPWFGIMKLLYMGRTQEVPTNSWYNFGISITLLIVVPFTLEYLYSKWKKEESRDFESEDEESFESDFEERPPPIT